MACGFSVMLEGVGHADKLRIVPCTSQKLDVDGLPVIIESDRKNDSRNAVGGSGISRRPKLALPPPPSLTLTSLNNPG